MSTVSVVVTCKVRGVVYAGKHDLGLERKKALWVSMLPAKVRCMIILLDYQPQTHVFVLLWSGEYVCICQAFHCRGEIDQNSAKRLERCIAVFAVPMHALSPGRLQDMGQCIGAAPRTHIVVE